jgi:asparagine synthase (glutamine-hydrolysing)
MILGSVSFLPGQNELPVPEDLVKASVTTGLSFNEVTGAWLRGGYFISSALPYNHQDFFYHSEEAGILVLLWGVLYNKDELAGLANSDISLPYPELIARLFLREGAEFVKKLNGDFALYIELPARKEAYIFRDHVGIRPIAYTYESERLIFSSDIVGLSRFISKEKDIDTEYLVGFFRYTDNRKTTGKKVKKLLPGHWLHFTDDSFDIFRYWDPAVIGTDKTLSYSHMLADLNYFLRDAIRIRCDKRFTAGGHVSGGLDSGILSALAREEYQYQDTFYGFSWSPAEYDKIKGEDDERGLIRRFCSEKDITAVFSDLTANSILDQLDSVLYSRFYYSEERVLEQAAERGVNLIFSGWGGDDFISTGDRGIEIDLLRGLRLRTFFRRNPVKPFRRFVKNFLVYVIYPLLGILAPATVRFFRNETRYLKGPFKKIDRRIIKNFYFHNSRHQLHLRLLEFYHIQDRCEVWAVNGYRYGIEYRYPLLDKRIIEFLLKVPSRLLCQSGQFRPLLREIGKGVLTEEIRTNISKYDAAFWNYLRELYRDAAGSLMEELSIWRENNELQFINFDLLERDIEKFRKNPNCKDADTLSRAILNIKAANEFTVKYRSGI